MPTKILLADKLKDGAFSSLQDVEVVTRPDLTAATLPDALEGVKILVVRSTEVTAAAIARAKKLELIVRAGSGVNNIDVAAASARGIFVANCPGKNAVAVAELTMGLILALDRRIADNVADLRAGKWAKGEYSKARGLKGQRLGLVGFGHIAQEVARRALAFDLEVSAYARSLTDKQAKAHGVRRAASLEEIFRESDIVSLHTPATSQTKGMVGEGLLGLMRDGAMLINTSRHQVVDNAALMKAAEAGKLRVGTDVFAAEPEGKAGAFSDPLGALPGVYGTHHIGASTDQAQDEIATCAIDIVRNYLQTGEVMFSVNLAAQPPVAGTVVVRHLDKVGVLAAVLGTLRSAQINVETMENIVFEGGVAACARIQVAQRPSDAVMLELDGLEHVISADLV
jgi:D-3-phosphoglycerate dehydrogenase